MTLLYIIYQTPTELFRINMKENSVKYNAAVKLAFDHEEDCVARWKIYNKRY